MVTGVQGRTNLWGPCTPERTGGRNAFKVSGNLSDLVQRKGEYPALIPFTIKVEGGGAKGYEARAEKRIAAHASDADDNQAKA